VVIEAWKDGVVRWRSRPVDLLSLQFGLAAEEGGGHLLALERHPSPMDGEIAVRPYVYGVSDHGLVARWRGTALAWPLLDVVVGAHGGLCALHRGDSFIRPDPSNMSRRTMRYRWNGFGFSAADAGPEDSACAASFRPFSAN
jgi:poly-gamma-glutamate synthesis protein (capsule biosynthesis protein)